VSTHVRERVSRSATRSLGVTRMPFGMNIGEAIAVLLAVVLLVWVAVYYVSSLRPEHERLRILNAELAEQQRNIIATTTPRDPEAPFVDTAKQALETLETFKTSHLKPFSSGRIDLIKEINALAKKTNVTLTSGIDMGSSLGESAGDGEKANTADKKSASRRKKADEIVSAIPSVAFRFTVFGQYASLRTFINELEREKQFVVINSINLTNQEAKTSSKRSRGDATSGIMLAIEMSAYFQPQ
jgi:hypothetical protein